MLSKQIARASDTRVHERQAPDIAPPIHAASCVTGTTSKPRPLLATGEVQA